MGSRRRRLLPVLAAVCGIAACRTAPPHVSAGDAVVGTGAGPPLGVCVPPGAARSAIASGMPAAVDSMFRGRVVALATGAPVPGATIRLEPGGVYARTDGEGEFRFLNVRRGRYLMRVDASGHLATAQDSVVFGELGVEVLVALAHDPGPGISHCVQPAAQRVVVTNRADRPDAHEDGWRLELVTRIEWEPLYRPANLSRVADLALDGDGNVYVLEFDPPELRVFDESGRYLRTIARPGEGPGELRAPYALAFDETGNLWVGDSGARRYSVFTPEGELIGSVDRPVPAGAARGQLRILGGTLYDFYTALVLENDSDPSSPAAGPGHAAIVVRMAGVPEVIRTVRFGLHDPPGLTWEDGARRGKVLAPFGRSRFFDVDTRGRVWIGTSDRYALHHLSGWGDTLSSVELDVPPVPFPDSIQSALESWYQDFTAQGYTGDRSVLPRAFPYFNGIAAAEDGTLWIQRQDTALAFDVFDPEEGRFLASVPVGTDVRSTGVHPYITSTHLATVLADSIGDQYVAVFRIRRPEG